MVAFLECNGVELTATNPEVLSMVLPLAGGELTEDELAVCHAPRRQPVCASRRLDPTTAQLSFLERTLRSVMEV
jgi:hypothetical protein